MDPALTRFQEIYKSRALRFGASSQSASLSQRVNNLHQQRRISRNTVMMSKRRINEGTLTPIASPATVKKKQTQVFVQEEKKDHRLEMLRKWQEQKRKQLDQKKANKKPLFKVQHLAVSSQYNLETVYSQIKGKPIATSKKTKHADQVQPRLAPSSSYKFKPPANIKPINFGTGSSNNLASTVRVTRSSVRIRQQLNFETVETTKSNPSKSGKPQNLKRLTRQNCVNVNSSEVQTNDVQSNKESNTVPEFTDEVFIVKDVCVPKNRSGKTQQTKSRKKSSTSSSLACPIASDANTTSSGTISSSQPVTPLNKYSDSGIYVSPFVTMSRGKENARKEFHRRSVRGGTDDESSTSPKAAATYFYKLLNNQTDRLRMLCQEWITYKDGQKPAEEICDMINVAVGQTELLLTKKFQQFKRLLVCCETGTSEKPVTCLDLHGFWDMVMIQVDNLDKRFENLKKLKENGWEEILPIPKPNQRKRPKRKVAQRPTVISSSSLRSAIQEARKKKSAEEQPSTSVFAKTPEVMKTRRSRRNSLRIPTLTSEARHMIGSPGLTMMTVTQAAKSAEKSMPSTPKDNYMRTSPKSILKSKKSKSKRNSKVVLFKESPPSLEDKENKQNTSNMMFFTPPSDTPKRRRSKRLANCQ